LQKILAGPLLHIDETEVGLRKGSEPISRGHGRNGADAYRGAEGIEVPHPSLKAGDSCPSCGEGIVYDKAPGVLVRVTGQPKRRSARRGLPSQRAKQTWAWKRRR
jgi:hypothetical protein